MFKTTMTVVAMMGLATVARADVAAGDVCADNLYADGKAIYAAVVAAGPTSETLRETVQAQTRSLAMDGKIAMGSARDNPQHAGECVRARLQ